MKREEGERSTKRYTQKALSLWGFKGAEDPVR